MYHQQFTSTLYNLTTSTIPVIPVYGFQSTQNISITHNIYSIENWSLHTSAHVPQYLQQHHTPATVPQQYCINHSYKNQNNSRPVQKHINKCKYCHNFQHGECCYKPWIDAREIIRRRHSHIKPPVINSSSDRQAKIIKELKLLQRKQKLLQKELASISADKKKKA